MSKRRVVYTIAFLVALSGASNLYSMDTLCRFASSIRTSITTGFSSVRTRFSNFWFSRKNRPLTHKIIAAVGKPQERKLDPKTEEEAYGIIEGILGHPKFEAMLRGGNIARDSKARK